MNFLIFRNRRAREAGLSLVELMVAMTIGLIITGMVGTVFISSKQSLRYQEATGRLQENARFAFDVMSYAVRNAGYLPCGPVSSTVKYANVVNDWSTSWWLDLSSPLVGYDGEESTFPSDFDDLDIAADSDALITVGVDAANETSVTGHNAVSAQLDTATHSIPAGAILAVSDCAQTTVFQMTGPNNANPTHIVHNTGTGEPGNCTKLLGASCGKTAVAYTFRDGSTVMRLQSHAFYVAPSQTGTGRSLWSLALNDSGSPSAVELIEDVEDMQLEYGEDTGTDGTPNRYVTADSVTNWDNVIAVRISLLLSTREDNLTSVPQTYRYNGEDITATDRRLRRSYSSVVTLRNRSK